MVSHKKWLIISYIPNSFFSLKLSNATSKSAPSHLIPTPLSIKMAFFASAFRVSNKTFAKNIINLIKKVDIEIKPPSNIIIQKSLIKVLQPSRKKKLRGFLDQTVIFREYVYLYDELEIALNIENLNEEDIQKIITLSMHIQCFGKKDSFFQYKSHKIVDDLSNDFTKIVKKNFRIDSSFNIIWLDDFTEMFKKAVDSYDKVNVYSGENLIMGTDRDVYPYKVFLKIENSGKNFTHYMKA
jgi:hypothetical protein